MMDISPTVAFLALNLIQRLVYFILFG